MRIGMAQMAIPWNSFEKNQKRCRIFFQEAKENKTDLLVFPEMTLTGFDVSAPELAEKERDIIDFFDELTREFQICAMYGYMGKGKIKHRNHLRVTDCGHQLMEYEKIHPFTFGSEGEYFEGGEKVTECSYQGEIISGMICYDLRFPEIFLQASKNSRCIFVIANWPEKRVSQWNALLRARAIENLCYVVGVNCTGQSGNLQYNGMSAAYRPDGTLIAGEQEEEGLIIADLDFEWLRAYRKQFPFYQDRRLEIYEQFYCKEDKRES